MKQRFIILLATSLLMISSATCFATPKAVPVNPNFEFEPMIEGPGLTHEFIIKNEGDTKLNILGVTPP
jgi:hypothetical protein